MDSESRKKVVILGFGHLGQFLHSNLTPEKGFQVVGIWNRTKEQLLGKVPDDIILSSMEDVVAVTCVDLIIEVAHPCVTKDFGPSLVSKASYLVKIVFPSWSFSAKIVFYLQIGSPTALSDPDLRDRLMSASKASGNSVFIAKGALWGARDIRDMSRSGQLQSLTITMSKHPSCFRLHPSLEEKLSLTERRVLYDGNVTDLCPLAPNNVNTMACAAVAADTLGFDGVRGVLVSDPSLTGEHVVEVNAEGRNGFSVSAIRRNPAAIAAVTGSATFKSFLTSVMNVREEGSGIHVV